MYKKRGVSGSCPNHPSSGLDNTVTNNKKKIVDVVFKTEPTISTNTRVILSGHHIEIYQYEKPIVLNRKPKIKINNFPEHEKPWEFEAYIVRRGEYRKRTKSRVVGQVQRLVELNFNKDSIFLTLTFNNSNDFDIKDLKICNLKIHNFMVKLKENFEDLKYLIVPEFQKRGAVHYHLIINRPYIEKKNIQKLWKYGFIKVKDIYYLQGIGHYFTKYLTKNSDDERLYGKRSFFTSKNLRRSKTVYSDLAERYIKLLKKNQIEPYFTKNYSSEFNGVVQYSKYYIEGKIQ